MGRGALAVSFWGAVSTPSHAFASLSFGGQKINE